MMTKTRIRNSDRYTILYPHPVDVDRDNFQDVIIVLKSLFPSRICLSKALKHHHPAALKAGIEH